MEGVAGEKQITEKMNVKNSLRGCLRKEGVGGGFKNVEELKLFKHMAGLEHGEKIMKQSFL